MKKRFFTLITLLVCVTSFIEAHTIQELFIEEPGQVLPLLSKKVKMDMIDYHNEGINKELPNALGNGTHFISVTDNFISLHTSNSTTVELLLTHHKKDSVIVTITTVSLPARDSRIEFYNTNWEKINVKKLIKTPTMKDFITIPKGDKTKKETVLKAIDFPLISYSINPDNCTITARHSLKEYMSDEDYEKISPYLKEHITIPF